MAKYYQKKRMPKRTKAQLRKSRKYNAKQVEAKASMTQSARAPKANKLIAIAITRKGCEDKSGKPPPSKKHSSTY